MHRGPRRHRRIPFVEDDAHDIGAQAGKAGYPDVVDVHVIAVAHRRGCGVLTSDENDLEPIVEALHSRIALFHV